jgi:hypothetical protein
MRTGARVPGSLASSITGATGGGVGAAIGAFAQRTPAVAPPRISVRTANAAGADPQIPRSAGLGVTSRTNNAGSAGNAGNIANPGSTNRAGTEGTSQEARQPSAAESVIRRSLAGTAEALFRSLNATGPQLPAVAFRSIDSALPERESVMDQEPSGHAGVPDHFGEGHQVIRRFSTYSDDASDSGMPLDVPGAAKPMSARDLDELIDRIVAKLERRVVADLERRSRRNLPGVF